MTLIPNYIFLMCKKYLKEDIYYAKGKERSRGTDR